MDDNSCITTAKLTIVIMVIAILENNNDNDNDKTLNIIVRKLTMVIP